MKRIWLLAVLAVWADGSLSANPVLNLTCGFTPSTPLSYSSSNCYSLDLRTLSSPVSIDGTSPQNDPTIHLVVPDNLVTTDSSQEPVSLLFDVALSGVGVGFSSGSAGEVKALINAYDGASPLGVYGIDATFLAGGAPGGSCYAPPNGPLGSVVCDSNVPFASFTGTHITRIVVSTTYSGFSSDLSGFSSFGNLKDEIPEPAVALMIGGGLAAIALWSKKHFARPK